MNGIFFVIVLMLCHWAADYTHLSTSWMLNAKKLGFPLIPILAHATVHAVLMGVASLFFCLNFSFLWKIFLFQLLTHFCIDVWKGKMNAWFPSLQNPMNKYHWYIFGIDQLLHNVAIICIYYYCFF